MRSWSWLVVGGALLVAAPVVVAQQVRQGPADGTPRETVTVAMKGLQGQDLGTVTLTQVGGNLQVKGDLRGLPPGARAIHFHEVGRCEPPFESAGEHFNPAGTEHGFLDPKGPHAGDLPNIKVRQDGRVLFQVSTSALSLGEGAGSVRDGDGSAIVIHARPDDYKTDPSGGSGDRIACGVVPGAASPSGAGSQ